MFCSRCGKQVPDNAAFCSACGNNLTGAAANNTNTAPVARWESTSVEVSPYDENRIIEVYEAFGWEFVSTQTIDSKNTHFEDGGTAIWSVTEHTNYVKLSFRRNKKMENYDKITEIEQRYYKNRPIVPSTTQTIIGDVLSIFKGKNDAWADYHEACRIQQACLEEVKKIL